MPGSSAAMTLLEIAQQAIASNIGNLLMSGTSISAYARVSPAPGKFLVAWCFGKESRSLHNLRAIVSEQCVLWLLEKMSLLFVIPEFAVPLDTGCHPSAAQPEILRQVRTALHEYDLD